MIALIVYKLQLVKGIVCRTVAIIFLQGYWIRNTGIRNTRYGQFFWTNTAICVNVVLTG